MHTRTSMRALCRGVLNGFCKILDNVKWHVVKTTITILSQTIYIAHLLRKISMISLFLHLLLFPAWEFLSNEWTTLAHMWFCLQFLVHFQKAVWKRTSPNKKKSTLYLVRTKASELVDFPGVNTPLVFVKLLFPLITWSCKSTVKLLFCLSHKPH